MKRIFRKIAAAMLGANGFQIFTQITFPHIKWAFLYGVVLCSARALAPQPHLLLLDEPFAAHFFIGFIQCFFRRELPL